MLTSGEKTVVAQALVERHHLSWGNALVVADTVADALAVFDGDVADRAAVPA